MEEVDEIVIHGLRQLGCEIESDIRSLREFSTELVFEGVVRCLRLILPTLELSHHVPPSMSARYRLGSTLASECTELGYKGEIGYQTFLYSNETDLRKVFLFLFEKLPKESEKVIAEPLGKTPLLLRECSIYFKECLSTPWLPHYSIARRSNTGQFFMLNKLLSDSVYQSFNITIPQYDKAWTESKKKLHAAYFENYMPVLKSQVGTQDALYCSVLQENMKQLVESNRVEGELPLKESKLQKDKLKKKAMNLMKQSMLKFKMPDNFESSFKTMSTDSKEGKGSRFSHTLDLQFTAKAKQTSLAIEEHKTESGVNKEEERRKMREEEVAQLQEKLDGIVADITRFELQIKKLESSNAQMSDMIKEETEKINNARDSYKVKKYTLSLLSDVDSNIAKLESLIDSSSQRLISLATQWEQHRVPLIEKYRDLKQLSSQRLNETQRKLEEIKQMHEKITEIGAEARYKDDMLKQLQVSYEKLTKDLNRSAYTKRILEIVGNIKKQKSEIDKILLDTRNVQKEINRLSGKLDRTFTVTDELIFRDAKRDEAVRRAYKLLAALHENCSQLVLITEESGFIVRKIRELEDQIEQESQKKVVATLERIMSDYKQMQQENATLMTQLK